MIYFIEAIGAGLLKIGFTDRDPQQRLKELQTGCPHKLKLLAVRDGDVGKEVELHDYFSHLRVNGEWFRLDDQLRIYVGFVAWVLPKLDRLRRDVDQICGAIGDDLQTKYWEFVNDSAWTTDQVRRVWAVLGEMNGWDGGEPQTVVRLRPSVTLGSADCRM